jgi:hypothetical protein
MQDKWGVLIHGWPSHIFCPALADPGLVMGSVKSRKLCANGYLHLSYYAIEITIHRHIIRSLAPENPEHVRSISRDAPRTRIKHAMAFVEKLRPEHLQSFRWFAAPKAWPSLAFSPR